MKYIAHRGNINGKSALYENEPGYIDKAIKQGFDAEIDIWYINSEQFGWSLFLGHDEPQHRIDFNWLIDRISHLWIHCKNIEAINYFRDCNFKFNFFWHQEDDIALTSLNYIWAYPGKQPIKNSVAVMPEIHNDDITECLALCSDIIVRYTNLN